MSVFGVGAATRIYVATGATDMRMGFSGLYGLVSGKLQLDPLSGHLFLFANRRRDRMKILYFDGSGLWVCAKQMQRGCLHWPEAESERVQLTHEQFSLLLGGIDLTQTQTRKWYRQDVIDTTTACSMTA